MAKINADAVFRANAPAIMAQLIRDFPITPTDAAAIVGNAGLGNYREALYVGINWKWDI